MSRASRDIISGDRAIEITRAFEEAAFDKFDRVRAPKIVYAGMLQYDGDLKLPQRFLVAPPAIRNTTGEWFELLATADVDLNGLTLSSGASQNFWRSGTRQLGLPNSF